METRTLLATALLFVMALTPAGSAERCTSSAGCDFWDNDYHEYILNDFDTGHIDVIIVPSAGPNALRDISTIEQSVQMWETAIQNEADAWLANNFEIDYYTVGYDDIPPGVLADPEIVIVSSEHDPALLFGIGLAVPVSWCHGLAPFGNEHWHQHTGSPWAVASVQCQGGGNQCVVVNTNFAAQELIQGTEPERRMYDLNSHEFGHCLGIGHVGDALDFDAKNYPRYDIMSYEYHNNHVHCVSSLNIKSLHGVYAEALGAPSGQPRYTGGEYVDMDPSQWVSYSCQNPDGLWELPGGGTVSDPLEGI